MAQSARGGDVDLRPTTRQSFYVAKRLFFGTVVGRGFQRELERLSNCGR